MEKLVFLLGVGLISQTLYSHQGESHNVEVDKSSDLSTNTLESISKIYEDKIAPIFESKCMDCHGEPQSIPWYYGLPIVKWIMNEDMEQAKQHLDMRSGFPFKGHGTVESDLDAILSSVENAEMPPLRYKLLHWSSFVDSKDKEQIKNWISLSKEIIKSQ